MSRIHSILLLTAALALSGCLEGISLGDAAGTPAPTPPSPDELEGVEAFGSVVAVQDAGSVSVVAEMAILTLSPEPRYVGGVVDPTLVFREEEIEMVTTDTPGVFQTNSTIAPTLSYVPGEYYSFRFTLVAEDGGRHDYEALVRAPVDNHDFEIAPGLAYFSGEPVDVTLFQMEDAGSIRVLRRGDSPAVTWSSFRYEGPASIESAVQSLIDGVGPVETIPGEAFPGPGNYAVQVTNLGLTATPGGDLMTENFGSYSWFAAGAARTAELRVE